MHQVVVAPLLHLIVFTMMVIAALLVQTFLFLVSLLLTGVE